MLRINQQYVQIKTLSNLQENTINLLKNNLDRLCGSIEINTPLNGILV